MGVLVAVFAQKGTHPTARLARCTMGFVVAIVWIMAIADEVVEVLQVNLTTPLLHYPITHLHSLPSLPLP